MARGWHGSDRHDRLPSNWGSIRRRILARDPSCCSCHINPSTQVDHIVRGDDHDEANLQGLCAPCHAEKTAAEGNRARIRRSNQRRPEAHPGMR